MSAHIKSHRGAGIELMGSMMSFIIKIINNEMRTIATKGIWVGRPIGVRVGLIEDAGLERLVANFDFDVAAFFEKLQPYFVNSELRRIKCSNCYWQITVDEREARAVLHAAFGDKADFVKRHWEILEIIYPNFAQAVSGNIVVIPDFDAHGRPLIVQLEEPEKYCAQDARRRPEDGGIFKSIYQKIFKGHKQ